MPGKEIYCPMCNGSGDCQACDGTGLHEGKVGDRPCELCSGSAVCDCCNGSGLDHGEPEDAALA